MKVSTLAIDDIERTMNSCCCSRKRCLCCRCAKQSIVASTRGSRGLRLPGADGVELCNGATMGADVKIWQCTMCNRSYNSNNASARDADRTYCNYS
jgi:hypothetical protein